MTTFFIDLWHDLRERRLWPVAVGLLAAIVAVPAILFKPVSDATPPTTAAPTPSGAPTLPVVSVETGPIHGSKLEAFRASEKNPFKPMKDLAVAPTSTSTPSPGAAAAGAGSKSSKTSGSGTSGSGSGSSGSGSSGFGGSGSGGSGSSSGGSSSSGGGSVSGGSPASSPSSPGSSTPSHSTTPTTQWFRYAADFSFGKSGAKAKVYKGASNFTLLPTDQNPAVVFLGAGPDGKTAMFYVADPGFTADGGGHCNSSGANCRYVTLKVGQSTGEETFSAVDGSVSYDLKLLKISRQSLGTGSTPAVPNSPKTGKTLAATGAGVSAATETTQAVLPEAFAQGPGVAVTQK